MQSIPFIQYLFPNGRKTLIAIERPDDIVKKADAIFRQGFRFEIENNGQFIHMTVSDDYGDYDARICDNGPPVVDNVDNMIIEFDIAKAIKQRERNMN